MTRREFLRPAAAGVAAGAGLAPAACAPVTRGDRRLDRINHVWLIAARTPHWPDAPADRRAQLDANGVLVKDGDVTPDGYVVNTAYTINQPHPARITDPKHLLPNLTFPTIGERLGEKGISWAWYTGGWNDALAGRPHPLFQYHHQPFAYFANYADGTPAKAEHLKDEEDFLRDLKQNRLPAVSFVKPLGPLNEHPGYADLLSGQEHMAGLVRAVMNSPYWKDPAIIISPHAKRRYVDHTLYDTTSILKFIEVRWGLRPLGPRDAAANDLTHAFDLS